MVLIPRDSTRRSLALAARGGWRRSPPRAHSRRSLEVRRRSPLHAPLARARSLRRVATLAPSRSLAPLAGGEATLAPPRAARSLARDEASPAPLLSLSLHAGLQTPMEMGAHRATLA